MTLPALVVEHIFILLKIIVVQLACSALLKHHVESILTGSWQAQQSTNHTYSTNIRR